MNTSVFLTCECSSEKKKVILEHRDCSPFVTSTERYFVIIVEAVLIFLFLVFDTIAVTCYAFNCVFRLLSVFNTTSQTDNTVLSYT